MGGDILEEKVVAKVDELSDGGMKKVECGEKEILLVKLDGEFHALGPECSHYGAPLEEGVLNEGRIRCPWHQACFDAVSGDIEEPPALDAISDFETKVKGEDVVVVLPEEVEYTRVTDMVSYNPGKDDRTFLVLGAGSAGNAAAETLRQSGYEGRIVMVTREENLPYDRPDLSKRYLKERVKQSPTLRSKEFYDRHDIEVLKGKEAVEVDFSDKIVVFEEGQELEYDKLLLATGGRPRRLSGSDLDRIFTLRTVEDANRINDAAEDSTRVLIVGASFIGMETAASLKESGLSVTVVAPESTPFERTLGKEVGQMFEEMHKEKGVNFRLGQKIERFEGEEKIESAVLEGGEEVKTDFVIAGIGVEPATGFLEDDDLNSDGSLSVDFNLRFKEDVYAAGDIARFPDWRTDDEIRIEHWRLAQQHGRIAAKNMTGDDADYSSIPFFWTRQFETSLQYVGYVEEWDEVIFDGDPSSRDFVGYYEKDGMILAAAGLGNSAKMVAIAELMQMDEMPSPEEIKTGSTDITGKLKR